MAVPVWHSGLTKSQSQDIERIQKAAMQIILQDKYINYQLACRTFSSLTLELRRVKLCSKFASKNLKSENCLFSTVVQSTNTRQKPNLVRDYKCYTRRYQNSSLPFLAKLLNGKVRQWGEFFPSAMLQNTLKCYLWTMGAVPARWFWPVLGHKFDMLSFLPLVLVSQ